MGANVSLDCTINPQPAEPYQYKWSASQSDAGWTTTDAANGSTLVAAVGINSTRHVRYFCSVYSRNVLLASGSLAVEIKGVVRGVARGSNMPLRLLSPEI